MSRGVNKVTIIGNLGKDPETRVNATGGTITHIAVATTSVWKNKGSDQPIERTEWHRIVFFNKLAEVARNYLRKGSRVYVEGSLRTNKWQDKQGVDHYTTEIVAQTMQMLGGRTNNETSNHNTYQTPEPDITLEDFTDDEIPF